MSFNKALAKVLSLAGREALGDKDHHAGLLRAIRELQLAAETPLETTSRLNFQIMQNISIRVAVEYGYLHVIAAKDGQPISATDLSQETKSDLLLTIRIMRVLTAIGLCDEVGYQLYAANERTRFDLDFGMQKGGKLVEYMRGPGIQQFADEPDAVTLFKYAHGTDVIFGLLEKNAEQKQAFDDYMAARRVEGMPQWFDIYPAAKIVQGAQTESGATFMVDVGGGPGQEIARFKEKHPELPGRFILQDLPLTLERIERLPDGVEVMEYDFFTPQPIKGSRIYFLRDVLHNWSDAKSAQILSRIVEAMDPKYSTLLIDDYVLPDTGSELRAAEMDILMWLHTAGLERTVSQWQSLFDQVGLELVKIWSSPKGNESVLEARIRG
ncbi:O-methyltransferase [Penicillium brasilianum]|uniref:O-methyltransferase n=1 Tax=Penicillium brasilianum TaxID=104259 RepID=A0A1S9RXM1_PENBI|nr:O-methyltransferase [Penicillium brasilianum]